MFVNIANAQGIHIETVSIQSTITNTLERPTKQPFAVKRLDYITDRQLREMVRKYAPRGQYEQMLTTIRCEAPKWKEEGELRYFYKGQSFIKTPKGREESYGLAQWHIPSGNLKENGEPFTIQDAQDPDTALYEMGRYFEMNLQYKWTCWRNAYSNG